MSRTKFRKHIVLHSIAAWGHNKPLITIAILIAEARKDVVLTILTNSFIHPKLLGELEKLPQERYHAIEAQINIINVVPPSSDPIRIDVEVVPAFESLFKQTGSLTCLSSGKTVNCADLPSPSLAIVDPFAQYLFDGIRAVATPSQVPILAWFTGSVGSLIAVWGPSHLDGKGDACLLVQEQANKTGRDIVELFHEIFEATEGKVMQIPGYPPFYDYELNPQQVPEMTIRGTATFVTMAAQSVKACDGIICIATSVLEREGILACKEYYESIGKSFSVIGPMAVFRVPESRKNENDTTKEVVEFLDKMQAEFGEKSVLYISFGTFWWPQDPSIFIAVIKELVSSKTPFILAHPSPLCQFPDELKQVITESPYAMEVVWSPQERILSHPATGWFLTHGGWNSIQEAIEYNVPLIFWPFGGDQPLNAALISLQHNAGFELLEVRTGEKGRQKPYRCGDASPTFTPESARKEMMGLLDTIKGEKGRIARANWEAISNDAGKVWEENGEARRELDSLLERYLN
ncbi:hypothetical protein VNI00_000156 [Paramarasmius palmivorus]|uniref:UDP-Glycosyltransferase/glycogen phosphorylase n=1 Tax=Paramarasmius palmivorus TaxID=297713 RepID=A0AAW0EC39_9AGAR